MSTQGDSPCAGAQPDSGGRHTAAQRFRLLTHPPLPPSSCHRQLIPGLPARAAAPPPSTSLERGSTTDTPIRPAAKRLVASCPRAPPLLPSARQRRASILGSWAVADKATALGVSESGTLPARACAVSADSSEQACSRLVYALVHHPLLPSARQRRASILGSWAVADKATALGVSESGTLPARARAVGAGGPRQGLVVA